MSQLSDLLAIPKPFVFEGQTYYVGLAVFEVECLFSTWVEERALLAIQRHERTYGPMAYQQQLTHLNIQIAAGAFEFDMPIVTQARFSPQGMRQLAFLQMCYGASKAPAGQTPSGKIDMATVERIYADEKKWAELVTKMAGQEYADPNVSPPGNGQDPGSVSLRSVPSSKSPGIAATTSAT